uniref:Uncharacterized protein n=1 Tax=Rhizophora mucronata TaxID=61149 RepID=A0A2P2QDD7_RHIMU
MVCVHFLSHATATRSTKSNNLLSLDHEKMVSSGSYLSF